MADDVAASQRQPRSPGSPEPARGGWLAGPVPIWPARGGWLAGPGGLRAAGGSWLAVAGGDVISHQAFPFRCVASG